MINFNTTRTQITKKFISQTKRRKLVVGKTLYCHPAVVAEWANESNPNSSRIDQEVKGLNNA